MKKLASVILLSSLVLVGCSTGESSSEGKQSSTQESTVISSTTVEETEVEVKVDKFAGQEEIGEGTFNIGSPSGNTADVAEVVVFYDPDTFPTDVSITTEGINGGLLSYLYADGELLDKQQLGHSMGGVELQSVESAVTEGKHVLQLVQYADDEEGGEIVTFKSQEYTVKLK